MDKEQKEEKLYLVSARTGGDDRICLKESAITSSVSQTLVRRHSLRRKLSRTSNLLAWSPQVLELKMQKCI